MPLIVAVDGGGTKTEACIFDAVGNRLASGKSGPSNPHFYPETYLDEITSAIRQAFNNLRRTPSKGVKKIVVVGLAGIRHREHEFENMEFFSDSKTIVVSDQLIAYKSAFLNRPGALLIFGTGSIIVYKTSILDGEIFSLGGSVFPNTGLGSGAWIGLEAARRYIDLVQKNETRNDFFRELSTIWPTGEALLTSKFSRYLPRDFAKAAPKIAELYFENNQIAVDLVSQQSIALFHQIEFLKSKGVVSFKTCGGLAAFWKLILNNDHGIELRIPEKDILYGSYLVAKDYLLA